MVWGIAQDKLLKQAVWMTPPCLRQRSLGVQRQVVLPLLPSWTETWTWPTLLISIDTDCISFSNKFPRLFNFKGHRSLFFADPHQKLMLRQLFTLFTMSLWTSLFPTMDLSIPSVWPKIFVVSPKTLYLTTLKQVTQGHLNYNTDTTLWHLLVSSALVSSANLICTSSVLSPI